MLIKECLKILNYFNADEFNLKEGAEYIKYLKVQPNNYIFRDGENSKSFYGIISGKVSIRHRKKDNDVKKWEDMEVVSKNLKDKINLSAKISLISSHNHSPIRKESVQDFEDSSSKDRKSIFSGLLKEVNSTLAKSTMKAGFLRRMSNKMKEKISKIEEVEVAVYDSGTSFGEISCLNNVPKRGSSLALEECHLIIIDKNNFERTAIYKFINKIDLERKALINNTIPQINKMPSQKFQELYTKFQTIYLKRNQVLFKEGDFIKNIYIVFRGEFVILKDISKPYSTNKNLKQHNYDNIFVKRSHLESNDQTSFIVDDEIIKNKNYKTVLKYTKGNITGCELSVGLEVYNHTLLVKSDLAVVVCINKYRLFELRNGIIESLYPIYQENENLIEKNVNSLQLLCEKMKINYRSASDCLTVNNPSDKKFIKQQEERDFKAAEFIENVQNYNFKKINNGLELKKYFLTKNYKPKNNKIISQNLLNLKSYFSNYSDRESHLVERKTSQKNLTKFIKENQGSTFYSRDNLFNKKNKIKIFITDKNSSLEIWFITFKNRVESELGYY